MIKKLDKYILTSFLGPFLFIFSILFFIFSVQFAFQEISKLVGRGLTFFEIAKLLFYLGTTVIQMVVPLSILLSSIMCFGGFGERYELAAMKASGISLARIMLPVFGFTLVVAVGLFFFSNNVLPDNHRKAKNLLYNIAQSKPALRFVSGQFNSNIPGFTMRVGEISGENSDQLKDIMIHKQATSYQDQTTVIAENGILNSTADKKYLKFELHKGFIYDSKIKSLDYVSRTKQPNTITEFDTLTMHVDVSALVEKALDNESISDHFRFYKFNKLQAVIDSTVHSQDSLFINQADASFRTVTNTTPEFDSIYIDVEDEYYHEPFIFEELPLEKQKSVLQSAISQVNMNIVQTIESHIKSLAWEKKIRSKMIVHQQRIISFSVMCLIFFLIGAPLGSIIRKGGLGMPVVVSIFIFIIWFIIYTYAESESKLGGLNPYVAAWLPNMVMLPLGIFLTKRAMEDSEIFDISRYNKVLKKISSLFIKKKKNTEHKRYQ
ncbi:MAG: LptF/LptG family permease [Flavobacteriales bacterium]|nr:LptF/LptG family permease [Flavobacteriales bacterium]